MRLSCMYYNYLSMHNIFHLINNILKRKYCNRLHFNTNYMDKYMPCKFHRFFNTLNLYIKNKIACYYSLNNLLDIQNM